MWEIYSLLRNFVRRELWYSWRGKDVDLTRNEWMSEKQRYLMFGPLKQMPGSGRWPAAAYALVNAEEQWLWAGHQRAHWSEICTFIIEDTAEPKAKLHFSFSCQCVAENKNHYNWSDLGARSGCGTVHNGDIRRAKYPHHTRHTLPAIGVNERSVYIPAKWGMQMMYEGYEQWIEWHDLFELKIAMLDAPRYKKLLFVCARGFCHKRKSMNTKRMPQPEQIQNICVVAWAKPLLTPICDWRSRSHHGLYPGSKRQFITMEILRNLKRAT